MTDPRGYIDSALLLRHPRSESQEGWGVRSPRTKFDIELLNACQTPWEVGLVVADRLHITGYDGSFALTFDSYRLVARAFERLAQITSRNAGTFINEQPSV